MAILTEGQNVRDTYTVERFLGEGAFAEVYRVRHRFLGRQAMKVLKARGTTLDEIQQMLGEAELLSRIGHPNIVRVFDANVLEINGSTFGYFTMEYIAGGSLDRYWRSFQSRMMPTTEVVEIVKQACVGIGVAHAETPPIVHRDIKPQNILIGYDGCGIRVRVSDFGLAKRVNPLTLLVSAKGTLSFKPPESFDNQDSPAADVWAIGTTLYLLLTDTLPFPELDDRDINDSVRFVRPLRPASVYNVGVDASLDSILSRCLARDHTERYLTATEVLQDLNSWEPQRARSRSSSNSSQSKLAKSALGRISGADIAGAEHLVAEAIRLAARPGSLMSAADMLEEAINKVPDLREKYESTLRLWRRGICM